AELLGLPAVSPVKKIVAVEDRALVVERITEDGTQVLRVELPALLGVSGEVNQPRYPAMKGTLIAKRAQIPTWRRPDLGLGDAERRLEVRRLYIETPQTKAELIAGDSPAAIGTRLAERLREAGLI